MLTYCEATGLWLRGNDDGYIEVLVEIDGQWRVTIREYVGEGCRTVGVITRPGNHEERWPVDSLAEGAK